MFAYQINIVPKWAIVNHDLYFISDKNKVHNKRTGKLLKMQLKGYTKGYCLSGKFYSLKQLRPLLIKYKEEYNPF